MKLKNIIKMVTTLSASVGLFMSCKDTATSDTNDANQPKATATTTEVITAPVTTATPVSAESLPVYIVTVFGRG